MGVSFFMSQTAFRTITSEPEVTEPIVSNFKENKVGAETNIVEEPIDSEKAGDAVLGALGIEDTERNMPEEDRSNLDEVKSYVQNILESKNLEPNRTNFKRVLNDLKFDMGLDFDAEPSAVLDRIGGVVKAWKSISFIRDPREKKSLFMKLARQPDSSSMNRIVFEEMEKRKVWQ